MAAAKMRRVGPCLLSGITAVAIFGGIIGLLPTEARAVAVNYRASTTGQTATAEFNFPDATHLDIILRETTPPASSSLGGAGAILTSVGFLLPGTVQIDFGTVTICSTALCGTDSASVGFKLGPNLADLPAGSDVSREWGATQGKKPIDSAGSWDFVSANAAQVTQFSGINRDGPDVLSGPQGGLLDDSAARGGLGVIDNAVFIHLTLTALLTSAQQTSFLFSVTRDSIVEWGSDAAFGTRVPEPASLVLLGSGLAALGAGACGWHRRRRRHGQRP